MKRQQEYCTQYARQNSRRPVATQTQRQCRRMRCNLFVVALAVSGSISTQVAQAVSLPRNIVSEIHYFQIDDLLAPLPPSVFNERRAFNNNPAPHVTNQDIGNNTLLVGTSYADPQGQWGNSAHSRFIESGINAQSFYIANFTKNDDQDVLTTKISNTSLSLRDFGSQVPGDMEAGFRLNVTLLPGAIDGTQPIDLNPATNPSLITAFDKLVSIQGRAGLIGPGTPSGPFTGPFQLFGDHDFFTGSYTEDLGANGGSVLGASYDLDKVSFEIALDQFSVGEDFTVVWTAITAAVSKGGETLADAQFWDPIGGTPGSFFSVGPGISPVPVPAAIWLFGSGLLGLVGISARKRKHNQG